MYTDACLKLIFAIIKSFKLQLHTIIALLFFHKIYFINTVIQNIHNFRQLYYVTLNTVHFVALKVDYLLKSKRKLTALR